MIDKTWGFVVKNTQISSNVTNLYVSWNIMQWKTILHYLKSPKTPQMFKKKNKVTFSDIVKGNLPISYFLRKSNNASEK